MTTALITGASRGFGRALARELAARDINLVVDARDRATLDEAAAEVRSLARTATVIAIPGDITDAAHRRELAQAAEEVGGLALLVNNAGALGPSPLPSLAELPPDALRELFEVNVLAALALTQRLLPLLCRHRGTVVNVTSDAAVEAYPGWGGYGASKAALDHLSAVLAVEHPELTVHAFDPGDMRTDMHQAAFPGEDISDRPTPEEAVPALLHLLDSTERPDHRRGGGLPEATGALL